MAKAALIAVAVLLTAANAGQAPSKDEMGAFARKVKELQGERIAVLKTAVEVGMSLAQHARIEISDALEDRMALLGAQLESAETDAARMALYRETVDSLKRLEDLAKARIEAARGNELALHRIRARRLEVEIRMERAKIQEAK